MGSRRSRRVSWATGPSLCKVRLFISEDSPSQAGLRPQDNLQAKGSASLMHAASPSSDDSLPPGFESLQPTNDLKIDISQIPLIRWKCPPHILLNPNWHLASGEESREIAVQNERMFGVLEAIYPRASNIPPNPFVSPDVKDSHYDDSGTPLVPVIPVEDDDASDQSEGPLLDQPNDYHQFDNYGPAEINGLQVSNTPITPAQQQPGGSTGVEADVLAAASAAYTAIMQSNQKGSMVDRDLLVKILSDPVQVERLMKEYNQIRNEQSTSSSVVAPMPPCPPPQMTMTAPASYSNHMTTFQNTNSTLPPPSPMAPRPMMNRPPQGYPPVPMNHPPGSSPAMNLPPAAMNHRPGSNPPMSHPPGSNPPMSRPPGSNPPMSRPPGSNPPMSRPPGSNPAMSHPPGSNPAMSHPLGSNPAMSHAPGSNPAMSYPPGSSSPAMNFSGAPPRAINYYKTLIHQHGGERQESFEQHGRQFGMYHQSVPPQTNGIDAMNGASMVNRDTKTRPTRPCAYFNGPRGCRNGANCTFLHDSSATSRQQEQQNGSKRIKLDSRITGRN
ncbi:zinc finger CCCH domain-containing protein 30 isoform X1 [Aegilops tauschii subsp. strangulata]|uniref:C3H1-type domain-containing protein n=1 Tax=Aegilops tauschii subsp. strangulata TaxID=200361 RepID=A0A453D4B9_AEGTS|nr:zinc finger CCCH domain-containing protein 30 [Aegilops tauschii subsp. strangulata]